MAVNLHPLISGTVGLWQFQNSLADTSGNGLDLVAVSGSATYATIAGSVVGFDFNAARRLEAPLSALLQLGGEFTIQFLIVPRATTVQTYVQCEVPAGAALYAWYRTTSHGYADQHATALLTPVVPDGYPTPSVNQWTLRRKSTGGANYTVEIFLNGVLQAPARATTTNTPATTERLFVGGYSSGPNLNAIMASLRILNYARADADVVADYVYVLGNSTTITLAASNAPLSTKVSIAGAAGIAFGSTARLGGAFPIAGSTSLSLSARGTARISSTPSTRTSTVGVSLSEFGPFTALSNAGTSHEVDAEWFVDFSRFGETVALTLSAIVNADVFYTSAPTIDVWLSEVSGSIAAATLAGTVTLPLAGTDGDYTGFTTTLLIPNPGDARYVILTSSNGF